MKKYKTGLVKEYEEELEYEENQSELKKKLNIEDENVVVVEKDDKVKFLIRMIIAIFKTAITISLLLLAAIGIFCLVYPNIRTEFIENIIMIKDQFFGFL